MSCLRLPASIPMNASSRSGCSTPGPLPASVLETVLGEARDRGTVAGELGKRWLQASEGSSPSLQLFPAAFQPGFRNSWMSTAARGSPACFGTLLSPARSLLALWGSSCLCVTFTRGQRCLLSCSLLASCTPPQCVCWAVCSDDGSLIPGGLCPLLPGQPRALPGLSPPSPSLCP